MIRLGIRFLLFLIDIIILFADHDDIIIFVLILAKPGAQIAV